MSRLTMLRHLLWGSLLTCALARPALAAPLVFDVVESALVLPLPELPPVPFVSVRIPPPEPLPDSLRLPLQAAADAQALLTALDIFEEVATSLDRRTLTRRAAEQGLDARAYRAAHRQGAAAILAQLRQDREQAGSRARDAAAQADAAMHTAHPDDAADVWRLLHLAEEAQADPVALAALAAALSARHLDGPHADRILYLRGRTVPAAHAQLIAQSPGTVYAAAARLSLARRALQQSDPEQATSHLDVLPTSPLRALFLAHAHSQTGDVERALAVLMPQLSDTPPELEAATSALTAHALLAADRDAALLSETSDPRLLAALADALVDHGRLDEAVDAYQRLIAADPMAPEAPRYQLACARLHLLQVPPAPERHAAALRVLLDAYAVDGEWWRANQTHPAALDEAREALRGIWLSAAQAAHIRAQQTRDPAAYASAAQQYGEYLSLTPADLEVQWYLADALAESGQHRDAVTILDALIAADSGYPARARLIAIYQQLLGPDITQRPDDAVLTATLPLPSGKPRAVHALGADHLAFIAAADVVATQEADMAPALLYTVGEIYHQHGHFDDARARFARIVEVWPRTPEAVYAAHAILNTWTEEEDLAQVRQQGLYFTTLPLGDAAAPIDEGLPDRTRQATLLLAQQRADAARAARSPAALRDAAEEYMAFVRSFPEVDQMYRVALYSAGVLFSQSGDAAAANSIFSQYVDLFPDDERSWPLMFRLGADALARLDTEAAAQRFETLYRQGRTEYPDAPSALYNVGLARHLQGDDAAAASAFEEYATAFRDHEDAGAVLLQAARCAARVDAAEASRLHTLYLSRHRGEDPDRTIAAYHALLLAAPDARTADRFRTMLLAEYAATSDRVGPNGRRLAGQAALESLSSMPTLAEEEAEGLRQIAAFADMEHSVAVLYRLGAAFLDESDDPAVQAKGRRYLQAAITHAEDTRHWSPWVAKAQERLGVVEAPLRSLPLLTPTADEATHWATARERLSQSPHDLSAYAQLGRAYLARGDGFRAQVIASAALSSVPGAETSAELSAVLGWGRWLDGDPLGGQRALEDAVRMDPAEPLAAAFLARARMHHRDWAGALTLLSAPDTAAGLTDRGICLQRLGRPDEAAAAYEAALALEPDAAAPRHNLSVLRSGQ